MGEVIDEALRVTFLARKKVDGRTTSRAFKTFFGGGILPGVELHSNAALEDQMNPQ